MLYCIVSASWRTGPASAESVGQREVGGVTCRVLYTWQLLGLAVKWLALVGTRWPNSSPGRMSRLRKHYSYLLGGSLLTKMASWAPSGCLPTRELTIACLLMSGHC